MASTPFQPSLKLTPHTTQDSNTNTTPRHPVKTYAFRSTKLLSPRHQTITHNDKQIYTVEASSFWFKPPILTLHASDSTGPVLAAAKVGAMGWDLSILLGDPADKTRTSTGKPPWTRLRRISQWKSAFYFYHEGKTYLWKRTRRPDLSAENAKRGTRSFKLVETAEEGSGRVVMVVSWESKWKPSREMLLDPGRVVFYEEVGKELEVLALVAVLGTVYRIRRNEVSVVFAIMFWALLASCS